MGKFWRWRVVTVYNNVNVLNATELYIYLKMVKMVTLCYTSFSTIKKYMQGFQSGFITLGSLKALLLTLIQDQSPYAMFCSQPHLILSSSFTSIPHWAPYCSTNTSGTLPASGPLYLLFPLPSTLFSQISAGLASSPPLGWPSYLEFNLHPISLACIIYSSQQLLPFRRFFTIFLYCLSSLTRHRIVTVS